ncbi:expressed unknown protein [Seminavis robusta]|uniref:DUF6824 domain-containing protein n=1 Tax=Seminavis robusta TaxID=568900 RepID=A0A9N8EAP2_9STRA|nr:expressed unknown protein [Seminavis robusta]|eukprot:Sro684_g186710.1 n/a (299) ;mRNA; r:10250-11232
MAPKDNKETKPVITETRPDDILCGKEKACVSHPGSINFRAVIDKFAPKYQEAITKQEKMNVTKEIYESLGSQNSRFLKYNAKAKAWEELTSLLARDKISHALRFANREKKSSAPSSTTKSKSSAKKTHRRNGSDSSNSTLSTAATELSLEDFEDMMLDSEPLDFEADDSVNDKPYAYEIPFDNLPAPTPVYSHSYAPHYYQQQPYGHPPQPYYHSHHYHSYQHYAPAPQHHMPPHHYEEPRHYEQPREEAAMMAFPEKPDVELPTREGSMDIDLSDIMSEPLIEWDMQTDNVYTINCQ